MTPTDESAAVGEQQSGPGQVVTSQLRLGFDKPERVTILDDVDFAAEPGDRIAIVGPSGCGKTTLLSSLAGLHEPQSGSILLDGVDPYSLTSAERRRLLATSIGYLPQHTYLLRHATALDNVLLGSIRASRRVRRQRRQRAIELMEALDIAHLQRRYPSELSGGQAQRTCIARALMSRPTLVLADEPTSSVPLDLTDRVLECIGANATTVIVSTHDPHVYTQLDEQIEVAHWQPDTSGRS